jgi:precorrin-2 dehydrogenase/sirohydrochlorin ferrochelatase
LFTEAEAVLPIVLTPETARIGLIGQGEALERRRALLAGAGIAAIPVDPAGDLDGLRILFVAGLAPNQSEALAARARRAGILVNVEDIPALCDFHVPAIVRRGDLLFSVSTRGRAPGLARRLREWLEQRFGPEWEEFSAELGEARTRWRGEGVEAAEISVRTRKIIEEKGWLG